MLYKRKGSPYWYVKLEKDGVVLRESTGTVDRTFAKAFALKRSKELYEVKTLDIERRTVHEALDRWVKEKGLKRTIGRDMEILSEIPGDTQLADLTHRMLADHLDAVAGRSSASTANRHRACIVALLNRAVGWGWIEHVPRLDVKQAAKHEPHWLTREEFERVAAELPRHAASMARFAVATGLRYGNVAGFKWDWIRDGVGYVPPGNAKAGKAIPVPLNASALVVVEEQRGKHADYVFTDHRGHAPVESIKTAWTKAVRKAGLCDVRFHDLRHSWASWHLQAGTPMHVLQRLGGWQSYDMITQVYGHFATEELSKFAQNV